MRLAIATAACAVGLAVAAPAFAQDTPDTSLDRGVRVRSLSAGWGNAWRYGIPGYGKTRSDVQFVAFHPSLGWLVIDRGEVFGEAAMFLYYRPERTMAAGPIAIGGRYHFGSRGRILPFVSGGTGIILMSLDIPELDRTINGQVFYGAGVRIRRGRNPGWRIEVRNHHISNAGTAGENLGLNAFMLLLGVEWFLSPPRGR